MADQVPLSPLPPLVEDSVEVVSVFVWVVVVDPAVEPLPPVTELPPVEDDVLAPVLEAVVLVVGFVVVVLLVLPALLDVATVAAPVVGTVKIGAPLVSFWVPELPPQAVSTRAESTAAIKMSVRERLRIGLAREREPANC